MYRKKNRESCSMLVRNQFLFNERLVLEIKADHASASQSFAARKNRSIA